MLSLYRIQVLQAYLDAVMNLRQFSWLPAFACSSVFNDDELRFMSMYFNR